MDVITVPQSTGHYFYVQEIEQDSFKNTEVDTLLDLNMEPGVCHIYGVLHKNKKIYLLLQYIQGNHGNGRHMYQRCK